MADIYGNILHSMTDTFASIISNNQNNIMKTLALVTIVMSIPTMIFSAYGMNFKDNEIPLNGEPNAFWLIVFIAFALSVSLTLYLIHKKMVLTGVTMSQIDLKELTKKNQEFIHIATQQFLKGRKDRC